MTATLRTVLECTVCHTRSGDITTNPKGWNGWMIAPIGCEVCPQCIEKDLKAKGFEIRIGQQSGRKFIYLHYAGAGG